MTSQEEIYDYLSFHKNKEYTTKMLSTVFDTDRQKVSSKLTKMRKNKFKWEGFVYRWSWITISGNQFRTLKYKVKK